MTTPTLILGPLVLLVGLAMPAYAQSPPSSAPPASAVAGTVLDISGAVMQAVDVRVFSEGAAAGDAPVREARTDGRGSFSLPLPPGVYRVEVAAPGFRTETRTVTVPGAAPLQVVLDLAIDLVLDVTPEETPLGDVTASLGSTTLMGDDLLDLPRNEEDLATYLLMLAGADLTGDLEEDILAHFQIDGLEDGRLPSPDQIAQIIIDPQSMRANGNGRPRIQIVTRPGTGRWRGSVDVGFADESLNARTPGEMRKEPRQTRDVAFSLDAPVIPNLLEMSLELSTGHDERAGDSLRAITPSGDLFSGVVQPQNDSGVEVNARLQLNTSHRIDVQFAGDTQRATNRGIGGFRLPERGSDRTQNSWRIQIGERMFTRTITNNVRVQIERRTSADMPVREGFAIDVADAFMGGGGTTSSSSDELRVRFDDTLRWSRGTWNVELGGNLQYQSRTSSSRTNQNGTYEFASLHDYCFATGFTGVNCAATWQIVSDAQEQGHDPVYLDARGRAHTIAGVPVTFTQTLGNADLTFRQVSFDSHVQVDRRFGQSANLGFGVRYDGTNHSRSFRRINPTASLRYQVTPTTLVSAGARLTFQDFNDRERLLRNDGSSYQSELFISSPSFPDPFQHGDIAISERTASRWVLDPEYRSPFSVTPQMSVTQQIPGNLRVTLSYNLGYGWRQRRTRNINAPFPGTPLPEDLLALPRDERQDLIDRMRPMYPYVGNVTQIESMGRSESRTLQVQVQPRRDLTLIGLSLSGNVNYNYRLAWDDNDFDNPYVPEWGVSRRDHEVQSQFRVRLPNDVPFTDPLLRAIAAATYQRLNLNFNLRANTGGLYSIRSGRDLNGDQSSNDRPVGVARNTERNPGSWNLNMTLTKEHRLAGTPAGRGGGEGGGGRGREQSGGRGGSGSGPTLRFQARVNNLLNRTQPRAYGSVVTSPLFGLPTGYTGGRTVDLSMRIGF